MTELPVRHSIQDLQARYDAGNRKPLEDLVRAWAGIQALPPDDPNSYFALGGYHGEPFHYREAVEALPDVDYYGYWGGWCQHGNVLFPLWHRAYVYALETALQTIVPDVMMAYWDETAADSLAGGVPAIFTQDTFRLDGKDIKNPLRSFVLPEALTDRIRPDQGAYVKPKGYETVRYPLSGLVGTPEAERETARHNAQYPDPVKNTELLNSNVVAWLYGGNPTPGHPNPPDRNKGIAALFAACLEAPNYTVFSNTTSAGQWSLSNSHAVALESPHNDIHLAVGGFDFPGQFQSGQVALANGDMGENNTAGLDPIFFFHHCNIDRVFWLWQKRHNQTEDLAIIPRFAGTSSSDSQGPTPGIAPGTQLDLSTPLQPFKNGFGNPFIGSDLVNIEKQLGFTYGPGSLDEPTGAVRALAAPALAGRRLTVAGIDRALFQGSFILSAWATVPSAGGGPAKEVYLGHHSVLSRGNVLRCRNCLTHLEVVAHFPLGDLADDEIARAEHRVEVHHRGLTSPGGGDVRLRAAAAPSPDADLPAGLRMELSISG